MGNREATDPSVLDAIGRALTGFRHQIPESVRAELAQTALRKILETPSEEIDDPPGFAYQVVRNLGRDWLKKKKEIPGIDSDPVGKSDHTGGNVFDAEKIWKLVEEVPAPENYKNILIEIYQNGETIADLARRVPKERFIKEQARLTKHHERALQWVRDQLGIQLRGKK